MVAQSLAQRAGSTCGPKVTQSTASRTWTSHALRRARHRQQLVAAIDRVRQQVALLEALGKCGSDTSVVVNPELVARLQKIAPCLEAQINASKRGLNAHSSRHLVDSDVHLMGNAAKHTFSKPIEEITPQGARMLQRGARREHIHGDGGHKVVSQSAPAKCLYCPGCNLYIAVNEVHGDAEAHGAEVDAHGDEVHDVETHPGVEAHGEAHDGKVYGDKTHGVEVYAEDEFTTQSVAVIEAAEDGARRQSLGFCGGPIYDATGAVEDVPVHIEFGAVFEAHCEMVHGDETHAELNAHGEACGHEERGAEVEAHAEVVHGVQTHGAKVHAEDESTIQTVVISVAAEDGDRRRVGEYCDVILPFKHCMFIDCWKQLLLQKGYVVNNFATHAQGDRRTNDEELQQPQPAGKLAKKKEAARLKQLARRARARSCTTAVADASAGKIATSSSNSSSPPTKTNPAKLRRIMRAAGHSEAPTNLGPNVIFIKGSG